MRRREVVAIIAALPPWSLLARAQNIKPKRLGVIMQGGPDYPALAALREGLQGRGLVEGTHFELITRRGAGDLDSAETAARKLEEEGCIVVVAFSTSASL